MGEFILNCSLGNMNLLFISILFISTACFASPSPDSPQDGPKKGFKFFASSTKRDPKLFFVLTTSSTSTLSTSTLCYSTAGLGSSSGTCKKKKKSIALAGYDWSHSEDISPSKIENDEEDDVSIDPKLDSGIETINARKGRQNNNIFNFLLYWITTTSTSTSTTFTRTRTLTLSAPQAADRYCIPADITEQCPTG